MTGDSSYEAWTLFLLTRDPVTVNLDLRTRLSPIETQMLHRVEASCLPS